MILDDPSTIFSTRPAIAVFSIPVTSGSVWNFPGATITDRDMVHASVPLWCVENIGIEVEK